MDNYPLIPGNLDTLFPYGSHQPTTTSLIWGLVATIVYIVIMIWNFKTWLRSELDLPK